MSVTYGLCSHLVLVCLRASSRTPPKLITASAKHRHPQIKKHRFAEKLFLWFKQFKGLRCLRYLTVILVFEISKEIDVFSLK